MKINKSIKIFINYFLGPILFAWLSYSIYLQIKRQPDLDNSWQMIRSSFGSAKVLFLVATFLLMIVNWGIEAFKWKIAVQKVQQVSYTTAFKAILSGTSFSVTTPNRVGEYLGRVLYMKEGNRLKAISLTIAGSMSQLLVTLVMGLTGFFILRRPIVNGDILGNSWIQAVVYGASAAALVLTVFYFRLSWIIRWIDRLPRVRNYAWLLRGLEEFNATLLLQILSLSLLRFFVFLTQYFLLFRLFNVDVSWWQGCWAVSVSFLVMAVLPTIALFTDLSLKGKISLALIGLFSRNELGIWVTSVTIWVINLIIPALAGSLLILGIKRIFKSNNDEKI